MNTIKNYVHAFAILFLFLFALTPVKAEIPIIANIGIPTQHMNMYRLREFKEAGFDVSFYHHGSMPVDTLVRFLDDAQAVGVRLLLGSNHLDNAPERCVKRINSHPALFGYYLYDEPRPKDIAMVNKRHSSIRKWDREKPCYMNLLPNLGRRSLDDLGIKSYEQYLRDASEIELPQISFDYYPITTDGIRDTWYGNLEAVRNESLRTKKPFWAFVLSTPHIVYPQPTIEMLRLQIYSDLAYGAQAIQYFTYWTPEPDKMYDYHDGPIGLDGKKTKTYYIVKRMNEELKGILPLFDGAEVKSVQHLVKVPEGTTRPSTLPANLLKLKVTGHEGALVSTFRSGGHEYLAIVNKDYQSSLKVTLKARSMVRQVTKQLQEQPVKSKYQLTGGDILVLKLR